MYVHRSTPSGIAARLAVLIRPADWLRLCSLRALGGWARPLVRNRELRVAVVGLAMICVGVICAFWIPLWILALGPLVVGIPHVLGDVRHLVVRPGLHRRPLLWLGGGVPVLACGLGADARVGVLAIFGVCLVSGASAVRRLGVALAGVSLAAALQLAGEARDIYFAHAHNFIAIGLWWFWRPRQGGLHWLVLVGFAGACGWIMSDVGATFLLRGDALSGSAGAMDVWYQLARLAPGVEFEWGVRLVVLYTFCQSMHYGVWLRLIPDEDRQRPTPPPFRTAFFHLWSDLRSPLMLGALGVCCIIAGWAVYDLMEANHGYFRLVRFHGFLELAAIAVFACEGHASWRKA